MLKEVTDGLKVVADGIKNIKTIVEAIKSGKSYLKTKHPEVHPDLRLMVQELSKSMIVVKRASAVLTNFSFAVSADVQESELVRFNNYSIQFKEEAQNLRDHIDYLRNHCSKVREHGKKIGEEVTVTGFTKVFTFLGLKSPEREQELGRRLDSLAYQDVHVANSAGVILSCLELR